MPASAVEGSGEWIHAVCLEDTRMSQPPDLVIYKLLRFTLVYLLLVWTWKGSSNLFILEFYMAMKIFLSIQKTDIEEAWETSFFKAALCICSIKRIYEIENHLDKVGK